MGLTIELEHIFPFLGDKISCLPIPSRAEACHSKHFRFAMTSAREGLSMKGSSFDAVLSDIQYRADQMLPDTIVHLADLRMDDDGRLQAPGGPSYRLNPWSQKQLATELGLRWGRWFEHSTPSEQAEEVNRRLKRLPGQRKIRGMRDKDGKADGIARAILSPSYVPIDNVRIFETLASPVFRAWMDEYVFTCVDHTDSNAHFAVVHRDGHSLQGDILHPGFRIRNSEVGSGAVSLDDYWLRLVCENGLMLRVGNKRLLYRTHRAIDGDLLTAALATALQKLPERWKVAFDTFDRAKGQLVPHPDTAIATILEGSDVPRSLVEEAQKASLRDNDPSRFGIAQAITWVAHQMNQSPEVRFVMEQRAGDYLMAE